MGNLPLGKAPGAVVTAKQVIDEHGDGLYLKGKTAVVTGGNSGIGLETCKGNFCSMPFKSYTNNFHPRKKHWPVQVVASLCALDLLRQVPCNRICFDVTSCPKSAEKAIKQELLQSGK